MIPESWTVMVGFPRQYIRGRVGSAVVQYKATTEPTQEVLRGLAGAMFDGLTFASAEVMPERGKGWWIVIVQFQFEAITWSSERDDGDPIYTVEDSGQELPVDLKKKDGTPYFENYLTNWNYHLAGEEGSAVPAWWATATDTTTDDDSAYRWIKEPDSLPEGWVIVKAKTKRLESVMVPSPVVVEQAWFRSYADASRRTQEVFRTKTPAKTFGYALQWLIVGSDVSPDGRRWQVTTRYQGAEEWDSEIYEAAT